MIAEIFKPKCKHRHTESSHPRCFVKGKAIDYDPSIASNILVFDVETLPILAYSFDVWNTNIYPQHIVKDWCLLSYSAKWLDGDGILSDILTPKEAIARDDRRIAKNLWRLVDIANVVITHNGKRFDIKKMNTRFWKHGLHRPSSYKVIDTLVTAKSVFGLTYNSMDFIAKYLDMQTKLETDFKLWVGCDKGDKDSLKYMVDYNERDIEVQEEIYMEMRDWMPAHPDLSLFTGMNGACPVCLSRAYTEIGIYVANSKKYKEYRCSDCGSIRHDAKAIKEEKEVGDV